MLLTFHTCHEVTNTISFNLEQFSFKLFSSDQVRTLISSLLLVSVLTAGTIVVSKLD